MAISKASPMLYSGPDFALSPDQIKALCPRTEAALWPEIDCHTCGKVYDTRYQITCPYCGNWRSINVL